MRVDDRMSWEGGNWVIQDTLWVDECQRVAQTLRPLDIFHQQWRVYVINAANLNYCHSNANFIGHVDVLRSLGRLHLHHRFSWFSSPRPDSMRAIDLCPMSSLVRLLRRSNSSLLSLLSLLATLFLYAKNFVAIDAIVFEMLLQKKTVQARHLRPLCWHKLLRGLATVFCAFYAKG